MKFLVLLSFLLAIQGLYGATLCNNPSSTPSGHAFGSFPMRSCSTTLNDNELAKLLLFGLETNSPLVESLGQFVVLDIVRQQFNRSASELSSLVNKANYELGKRGTSHTELGSAIHRYIAGPQNHMMPVSDFHDQVIEEEDVDIKLAKYINKKRHSDSAK